MFKHVIHLTLIFANSVKWASRFMFYYMFIQLFQLHLLKRLLLLNCLDIFVENELFFNMRVFFLDSVFILMSHYLKHCRFKTSLEIRWSKSFSYFSRLFS